MATVNFCGWETGDSSEAVLTAGTFSVQTSVKRTGSYALRVNPTTTATGRHKFVPYVSTTGLADGAGTTANIFFTVYFRYATKPAANSEEILACTNGTNVMALRLNSTGTLSLYDTTTLIADGATVLAQDTWYRIECNFNDTANTQEVKLDGTVEISGSATTAAAWNGVNLGKSNDRNGQSVDLFYDDFIYSNTGYIGAGEAKIAVPIGAGTYNNFEDGTGTTFAEVDEIPPNTTDYVQNTSGISVHKIFDMQASATIGLVGSIVSVKPWVLMAESSSTTTAGAMRFLASGTEVGTTATDLGNTTYVQIARMRDTDPGTSAAWTTTGFDTLEVGPSKGVDTSSIRCTFVAASVWTDGVVAGGTVVQDIIGAGVVPFAR